MRAFKKRPGNLGRLFPDPVIDYKRRAAGERDDPGRAGDEDQQPASIQPGPIFEDEDWPTEKDAPVEEGPKRPG